MRRVECSAHQETDVLAGEGNLRRQFKKSEFVAVIGYHFGSPRLSSLFQVHLHYFVLGDEEASEVLHFEEEMHLDDVH